MKLDNSLYLTISALNADRISELTFINYDKASNEIISNDTVTIVTVSPYGYV
jgi:hypothetical protein